MPRKTDASQGISTHSNVAELTVRKLPDSASTGNKRKEHDRANNREPKHRSTPDGQRLGTGIPTISKWPGGSWRGKTAAVAGLTKGHAEAAYTRTKAVQTHNSTTPFPQQSLSVFSIPDKGVVALESPTRSNVAERIQEMQVEKEIKKENITNGASKTIEPRSASESVLHIPETGPVQNSAAKLNDSSKERPIPSAGWLGWWSKSPPVQNNQDGNHNEVKCADQSSVEEIGKQQQVQEANASQSSMNHGDEISAECRDNRTTSEVAVSHLSSQETSELVSISGGSSDQQRASWFGYWSSTTPGLEDKPTKSIVIQKTSPDPVPTAIAPSPSAQGPDSGEKEISKSECPPGQAQASRGWTFWSRQPPEAHSHAAHNSDEATTVENESRTGITPKQMIPTATEVHSIKGKARELTPAPKINPSLASAKTIALADDISASGKTDSLPKTPEIPTTTSGSIRDGTTTVTESSNLAATISLPSKAKGTINSSTNTDQRPGTPLERSAGKGAQTQSNLVLPAFHDTYQIVNPKNYRQRLADTLGRVVKPDMKHVSISPTPFRPRKALVVGCHGLFPHMYVQKVLGAPKGTSIRFANGASEALQRWTARQGYSCEIEKLALEGEGLIADRIDMLWKLLLNWTSKIRKADFIVIACHSQGVPVSVVLMSKLVEQGYIKPSARLSVCSMAGVNLGPFPSYLGKMFGASATELFLFSNPDSSISTIYLSALALCVRHHVRLTYISSIDDQLVSIESAIFATVSHPYIYRAVFVDGRIHAPDFLTKLVGFAMKLRNLGVSDHGLIRELSTPLAGSLYSGEGHSRVYEEDGVYDAAINFALESTQIDGRVPELTVKQGYEVPTAVNTNPYFLPWAMRGVLEESIVKGQLKGEVQELLKLFEEWRPTSKVLKDVRFRLEAVKSHS